MRTISKDQAVLLIQAEGCQFGIIWTRGVLTTSTAVLLLRKQP